MLGDLIEMKQRIYSRHVLSEPTHSKFCEKANALNEGDDLMLLDDAVFIEAHFLPFNSKFFAIGLHLRVQIAEMVGAGIIVKTLFDASRHAPTDERFFFVNGDIEAGLFEFISSNESGDPCANDGDAFHNVGRLIVSGGLVKRRCVVGL